MSFPSLHRCCLLASKFICFPRRAKRRLSLYYCTLIIQAVQDPENLLADNLLSCQQIPFHCLSFFCRTALIFQPVLLSSWAGSVLPSCLLLPAFGMNVFPNKLGCASARVTLLCLHYVSSTSTFPSSLIDPHLLPPVGSRGRGKDQHVT